MVARGAILVAPGFSRRTIQDTPTHEHRHSEAGSSFRNLLFHNAVGVFFDDFIFYALAAQGRLAGYAQKHGCF